MRISLVGAAAFAAVFVAFTDPPVAIAQSGCSVAGRYSVIGRDPGSSGQYRGEALISANGTGCHVRWFPPNSSEGTGTYSNGVLTIYFTMANNGATGVVKYDRAANGDFHGVWWLNGRESNQGTETLRPM